MALTITEAQAVNTVLNGLTSLAPDEIPGDMAAALETLAHGAHRALAAGWTVAKVAETWPTLTPAAVRS